MCRLKLLKIFVNFWIIGMSKVVGEHDFSMNPLKTDLSVWHQRNTRVAIRTNEQLTCEKPDIYICEEPPNSVPPDSGKNCNYRNIDYHEQVYRWVAGRGCLLYTPDFLYTAGVNPINLNAGCAYGNLFAPCLEIAKEDGTCGCYPFDPAFEEVANAVRDALLPAAHGRWEKCYYEANDCCSHFMNANANVNSTDRNQCSTTFDGWTCWHATDVDYTATAVCSEFAYSSSGPTCHHFSSKHCFANGTWELMTDYSSCSISPRLVRRYRFHIAVLAVSVAASVPAVFVFCFYRRLRVTRVALHRNLLIAIIIRNILVIITRSEIYIDELTNSGDTVMSEHGVWCRVLAVFERAAANAVFVCMLAEGVYLHRLIVAVFRRELNINLLYAAGALIVVLPVIAWALVMSMYNDHSCWMVYTVSHVQWLLDTPRILILLVNTVLFMDVIRVLVTKVRHSENANQLNTAKATLFLMPLFGVQFVLTAIRPTTTDCISEQAYYYFAYALEGLQGFLVATLYCYINKEVRGLIKTTYKKTEKALVSRVRDSSFPRISSDNNTDRRLTYSTGLTTNDESKNTLSKPKLHVAEIISIQASERLAEILDPVYETIDIGMPNEGYDCLERSDMDNDSGFIRNRNFKIEDYYGFTNASSVSIGCQDWLKCVSSPVSSIYNNSIAEYEKTRFDILGVPREQIYEKPLTNPLYVEYQNVFKRNNPEIENNENITHVENENAEEKFDCEMLDEIMQCIKTDDDDVNLDGNILSPNRPNEDKIIIVED